MSIAIPRNSHNGNTAAGTGPSTSGTRGIKGLFSRNKVISPEPGETTRSRFRTLVDDVSGRTLGHKATQRESHVRGIIGRSISRSGGKDRDTHQTRRPTVRHRPQSPEATARRDRVGVAFPPSIQKGNDGKWQQPSLSKGSMSTSALAQLRDEGDDDRTARQAEPKRGKPGIHALFGTGRVDKDMATRMEMRSPAGRTIRLADETRPSVTSHGMQPGPKGAPAPSVVIRSRDTIRPIPKTPTRPAVPPTSFTRGEEPHRGPSTRPGSRHTSRVEVSSRPNSPPTSQIRPSRQPTDSGANTATVTRVRAQTSSGSPPPMAGSVRARSAAHLRSESTVSEFLSLEHYHIRLATSFLLKTLTLIVKGTAFTASEKNLEMKKLAEERLAQLGRLERHWGAEWIRAAAAGFDQKEGEGLVRQDEKVRMANIGERAKERERRGFLDALRDGVLLCLYLNFLFPAQPSHITRINMSDDGIHKITNIPRFVQACTAVNKPVDGTLRAEYVLDGAETSTGRLAFTVVSLARSAGRRSALRSKSPTPTTSPVTSRPSSRGATMTPPGSPPQRTSNLTTPTPPISPTRPTIAPRLAVPTRSSPPQSRMMERNRSADSANDLQTKLQAVVEVPPVSPLKQSFPTTPPTSGFSVSSSDTGTPSKVALLPRQSLSRSQAQPHVSPTLRPKSTTPNSTSGSTTPTHSRRPSLRPRNTTGGAAVTGTRVSFAENEPNSAITDATSRSSISSLGGNVGQHVKERTPSLVSGSTSRTTSAYTRSSAAYSTLTVLGDVADSVTVADDLDDDVSLTGSPNMRDRSRRNSEKTLHIARQKFIGSLVPPNDLAGIVRTPINETIGREEVLRAEAFSKSLAALEGGPPAARSGPTRSTSNKRTSIPEHAASDLSNAAEEEVDSFPPDLAQAGQRHGFNNRFYLSSRSTSPTQLELSPDPSPTLGGFSFGPPPIAARPMSRSSSRTSVESTRPGSKADRRVSDRNVVYRSKHAMSSTDVTGAPTEFGRPDSRSGRNSMVTSSSSGRQSGDRRGRSRPVSMLMLEFENGLGEIVRYQLGGTIGRGQFGVVYKALNMSTGQIVAVKRISLEGMDDKQVKEVMREVELLKTLSHPSIVKYEGMKRDDDTLDIILEYAENGSLGSLIKDFGSLSETLVASYTAKILEGLDYLHKQGVIHRDLKAANILSTKNGNVKLSDFGVSLNTKAVENIKLEIMTASKNGGKANLSDVVGTPNWMAPEIIDMTGASFSSDIWSLGCTIVELLTGLPPYASVKNSLSVMYRIVEDDVPPIPPGLPEDLDHFLTLCFQKEPRARPSARQLFGHPWLLKNCPELSMLRGQDSIPFLRRVGTDAFRITTGQLFPDQRPTLRSRPMSLAVSTLSKPDTDSARKRLSFSGSTKRSRENLVKAHQLVKTTFAKAIICRVCDTRAKAGVLCQDCGLICHAGCVTKEVNRCDPLEQLALYTRQRELSTSATAGADDSTVSLGHYPLKLDSTITALPANIWKRSRAALERRGSNMLAPPGRQSANPSVDDLSPSRGAMSSSVSSRADSSNSKKENLRRPRGGDGSSDDQDTVRQSTTSLASKGAIVNDQSEKPVNGHAKGKDSKSDCLVM